ncbi:MAG: efflux transporter periplasmic adaptor subunit [Proteobacteria bacterium]|mgnify:CR=1 FL=1|nr:efflux transporter periplasmic adaptor subunit [Pseudomonadota bacterium]
MKKKLLSFVVLSIFFVTVFVGCGASDSVSSKAESVKAAEGKAKKEKPPRGLPVKAEKVRVERVVDKVTAIGSLLAEESVVIRPEIDGRITFLHFAEGQAVKAGAQLVTIDSSEYTAQLNAIKADLRTEQQRFDRLQELFEQEFISKEALDIQQGAVEKLAARVEEALSVLNKTKITAPFSGILGLREVSPGAYVRAGADIVRLENISSIKVDFRVPEVYLSQIKGRPQVSLKLDAYPKENFSGRVYAVQPAVDETTRTVLMRARISNKLGKLKPGMFARVSLTLDIRPNAITVPEQALWPQGTQNYVFKVVNGIVKLTEVVVGKRQPGTVEINSGLESGDVVVTEGQIKLRDGAPVMVLGSGGPDGQKKMPSGDTPKSDRKS